MNEPRRRGPAWLRRVTRVRRGLPLACCALLLLFGQAEIRSRGLQAGFAVVALPAPDGAPLAGYGGLRSRIAQGVLDPPEARAVVLASEQQRIALVALDLVIIRPELREALARALADLELDSLTVLATHTHSGPGGYIRGWLAERITSGAFVPGAQERLAAAGAEAVKKAYADLAPASAASGLAHAALARNRRQPGGPSETELPVLVLRFADGRAPIALFSYGMHPTVLTPESRGYSADYVGALRAWLEGRGVRALFLPGPMGDQGPPASGRQAQDESERSREIGEALGKEVLAQVEALAPQADSTLASAQTALHLPELRVRRFCALWWLSPLVSGSARALISDDVPIQAVRVGTALLVGLPAEPSHAIGEEIRQRVRQQSDGLVPFVLAHANDWIGYSVDAQTYDRGGYEACLSFHGRGLAGQLVDAAARAAAQLARPGAGATEPRP